MRKVSKVITAQLLDFSELSHPEKELLEAARLVRRNAQAPYSHYWVGAAVRSESGKIYVGCNIERASYTQTVHAEDAAVTAMIKTEGRGTKVTAVATVHGPGGKMVNFADKTNPPKKRIIDQICVACGQCLQLIWENCLGDTKVMLLTRTGWGEIAITTIGDAYPMPFGPKDLGVDYRKLKAIS